MHIYNISDTVQYLKTEAWSAELIIIQSGKYQITHLV